jgi:hypothetical protein
VNTFASLERVFALKKVTFYTVRLEGAQRTLWEQFLDDHEDEQFDDDLNILRSALVRIGNETGARPQFFRFEGDRGGDASALPPPTHLLQGETTSLRLYCLRFSTSVVILFSGAVKTAPTPQECDQVRAHFQLANRICRAIQEAVRAQELNEDPLGNLLFDDDFELDLS